MKKLIPINILLFMGLSSFTGLIQTAEEKLKDIGKAKTSTTNLSFENLGDPKQQKYELFIKTFKTAITSPDYEFNLEPGFSGDKYNKQKIEQPISEKNTVGMIAAIYPLASKSNVEQFPQGKANYNFSIVDSIPTTDPTKPILSWPKIKFDSATDEAQTTGKQKLTFKNLSNTNQLIVLIKRPDKTIIKSVSSTMWDKDTAKTIEIDAADEFYVMAAYLSIQNKKILEKVEPDSSYSIKIDINNAQGAINWYPQKINK